MTEFDTNPDAVIIGAGPAGATAAALLARAGRRVVVFEQKRFPRGKICGGCLSGIAIDQVRRVLGPDADLPGGATSRITFVVGTYRIPCNAAGQTRVVSRADLDTRLASAAAQAGARVRFESPAHLVRERGRWAIRAGNDVLGPRWILVAAGLARLPAELEIKTAPPRSPLLGQQWTQPYESELPRPGEIEMHWLRGGYVGLATLPSGRTIVALAAETSALDGAAPFERLRRLNPGADVFKRLQDDAPHRFHSVGTAGFPWRPRLLGGDNVLLIGDAAGFEEPFSGEGIGQAMRSARLAAEAIIAGQSIAQRYASAMRVHHRTMRRTRMLGRALRSEWIHRLATHRPMLPRPVLATIIRRLHVGGAT